MRPKHVFPKSNRHSNRESLRRLGTSRRSRAVTAALGRFVALNQPADIRILSSVLFLLLFS